MKKKDIIQLVKETVKEVDQFGNRQGPSNFQTSAVAPTDEYPFSRRPKRTGTGMMDEEGESWGLEPRQLADSFTFEELEQLYKDNKISKEDLNGAKSYLQSWIDMHPTYLPQRDLTTSKRQAVRDKYLTDLKINNDMKITQEADTKTYAGVDAAISMKKDPRYGTLSGDAKIDLEKKLKDGGTVELEETHDLEHIQKGKMVHLNEYFEDIGKMKLGDTTIDVGYAKMDLVPGESYISKGSARMFSGEEPASSKFSEPLAEYMKERGDSNLMEHMDKHRKRVVLMEGAMKKFFEMFDMGKTDEEIVQDYAQRGTQVPEMFVNKARKQYEGLKKMKLELEMSEKEYKNSATQIVNNPATGEMDGSTTMETKQLATDLFNEEESINKK